MGGLRSRMPVTFWTFLLAALALSGVAPLAGFFSKDEILAAGSTLNFPIYILLAIAAFLTAFYMGRQVVMVFFGKARSDAAAHAKENPTVMLVPMLILAVFSVIGGAFNFPGVSSLEKWLEHTLTAITPAAFVPLIAAVSTVIALLGLLLGWLIYGRVPLQKGQDDPLRKGLGPLFTGMERKWWVDELYEAVVLHPYHQFSEFLAHPVDAGLIDGIANGLGEGARSLSSGLRRLQTGYVRSYALYVVAGVVVILAYLILR